MNCWPSGKYFNLLYMYSIFGRSSFCFNYCLNSAWRGGEQFVALLRWCGSPGFFDSGLQLICIVGSGVSHLDSLWQWFSNFLHQVPLQKIFGFPNTTIMTNIKMQYCCSSGCPLLRVCVHGVCVCVHCCVCVHFGWVKCRAQIPSMSRHFHFQ